MLKNCFAVVLVLAVSLSAAAQQFSGWNTATNIGPLNTTATETDPFISQDGLSLYFACDETLSDTPPALCADGSGIYVVQRANMNDPWGQPHNLAPLIGPGSRPLLSPDEHRLFFSSSREGGLGGSDIWVARRHNRRDDFGWSTPENVGPAVNSPANESTGSLFDDDRTGITTFYFDSDRAVPNVFHIYASTLQADETFGEAVPVPELNSPAEETEANDRRPMARRDGLEIFLLSNRSGSMLNLKGKPSFDLWTSTRASTSDPWSTPVNVDPFGTNYINTGKHDGGPALSSDGTMLYFHAAQRTENAGVNCPASAKCYFDIWVTTRERLLGSGTENH